MAQTEIHVHGMTCEHCVKAVTEELQEMPGVEEISIDLVSGGDSAVRIISTDALDRAAVAAAIDEAGYTLAG